MKDESKVLGVYGGPIDGVEVVRRNAIPDERGVVFHMLRNDDPLFDKFGEIYFSMIYPGVIKAWHIHKKMTLNYSVVVGKIKLVLFDGREGSPTKGNIMEIFMGEDNRLLVKIPPLVWNGFKAVGQEKAILANCSSLPHSPDEIGRADPFTKEIPYDWDVRSG